MAFLIPEAAWGSKLKSSGEIGNTIPLKGIERGKDPEGCLGMFPGDRWFKL